MCCCFGTFIYLKSEYCWALYWSWWQHWWRWGLEHLQVHKGLSVVGPLIIVEKVKCTCRVQSTSRLLILLRWWIYETWSGRGGWWRETVQEHLKLAPFNSLERYWKHIYDMTCLGAFLTAQESQLITALLFCLRHTLIFSGSSINPSESTYPKEMIQTGIFTIDVMNLYSSLKMCMRPFMKESTLVKTSMSL